MNKFARFLLLTAICVIAISYSPMPVFGEDPGDSVATCAITVSVLSIIEWEGAAFPAIDIDAESADAPIAAHADDPCGHSDFTLWTNCDVELSANIADNAARLTDGTDTLVTKYRILTDGDGDPCTGAATLAVAASSSDVFTLYSSFLSEPLDITHVPTDGSVEVTLWVQATNEADEVSDSGSYSATQTITAAWVNDD